jgi:HD-like signal output (HDOD) protein
MSSKDSGLALRAPNDFLRDIVVALDAGTVELPAFPKVVIEVQEVLRNPNYSIQMMARPISADPTLASRLLNLANSTAFNATGRVIIDLGVALTRIGAQKVYSVVLAHAIQHIRRDESLRSIAKPLEEIWSESVAVAHFCDVVVKRLRLPIQDAFAAGLLHRIGHMYILVQCAKHAPPQSHAAIPPNLVDAWHPTIAKAVLKNWHMGDAVCEAVGAQAEAVAGRTGAATLADVLIAGTRLARRMKNPTDTSALSSGGVLARLNLSIEDCQRLISEAEADIRALERALHR